MGGGEERGGGCSAFVSQGRAPVKANPVCEFVCEKFPKSAKMWISVENLTTPDLTISISYPNLRKLGNSGVMPTNP